MIIDFILNGHPAQIESAPDRRVIDILREDLGLTGAKEGCGTGECGACTILVNKTAKLACLMIAAQIDGQEIITIEGMAQPEGLHPLQKAFVDSGAVQCGFCTPGMVMAWAALLEHDPAPSDDEIRAALSGNLCRCTGYQKIVDGVKQCCRDMHEEKEQS